MEIMLGTRYIWVKKVNDKYVPSSASEATGVGILPGDILEYPHIPRESIIPKDTGERLVGRPSEGKYKKVFFCRYLKDPIKEWESKDAQQTNPIS